MYDVVVTDHDFADLSIEREVLEGVATVEALHDRAAGDEGGPHERLREADALLTLRYELDEAAIDILDSCRVVARYGVGVDNVAVEAAIRRDIRVTNVPDYCVEEVATHALALALALVRGIGRYDASVARGEWNREVAAPLRRLSTLTVGVVGFGAIGRAVGERAAALGADLVASDPLLSPGDVADSPAELVPFEEVLERADVVTVHAPLTDGTRGLFDGDAFARMKESAHLVNVARGPIVDDDALYEALETGEIAGAALDVFPEEPPADDHPLRDRERVLATPHVAWYSEEANEERRRTAAECVRAVLTGERPEHAVDDLD